MSMISRSSHEIGSWLEVQMQRRFVRDGSITLPKLEHIFECNSLSCKLKTTASLNQNFLITPACYDASLDSHITHSNR